MELLWPVIRQQLMGDIRTKGRAELKCLRTAGETYAAWLSVPTEELLVRWVNHHLGDGVLQSFEQEKVRSQSNPLHKYTHVVQFD